MAEAEATPLTGQPIPGGVARPALPPDCSYDTVGIGCCRQRGERRFAPSERVVTPGVEDRPTRPCGIPSRWCLASPGGILPAMSIPAIPAPDDLEFPRPETHVTRAERIAREKITAAERAKRWRDEARAAAALDACIVAGLGRAFGLRHTVPGGPEEHAAVTLRTIINQSAVAYRNNGGDYAEGAAAIGARLQALISDPPRRT